MYWIPLFVQLVLGLLNKKKYEQIKLKQCEFFTLQIAVCFVTQEDELSSFRESIEAVDQNRPPLRAINGYSILDHLGTGAFGSVFKVRRMRCVCVASGLKRHLFQHTFWTTGAKADRPEPPGPEGGESP